MKTTVEQKVKVLATFNLNDVHLNSNWYYEEFKEKFDSLELQGTFYVVNAYGWEGEQEITVCETWEKVLEAISVGENHSIILREAGEKNTIDGETHADDSPTGTYYTIMSGTRAIKEGLINRNTNQILKI